jgi:xanthine dehydrogenase accessory factor
LLGSIGGGCSEAEVINAARRLLDGGGHRLMTVDLTGDAAEEEEGMACGGIMEVFIETC